MKELSLIIDQAVDALKAITPQSLMPDLIATSERRLRELDTRGWVDAFVMTLPVRPSGEQEQEDYRIQMQLIADRLNKQTDILNHELTRIKTLRATLNLGRLDPLIEAARAIVRPLYTLSASLQD